ncbi:hypothetical protein [Paucihalobacter sp.]|uniref:hypothetical protein n=1 Tax=Paucihalobacter sp. TaxID=2850405 RepID=UPI002FE0719B
MFRFIVIFFCCCQGTLAQIQILDKENKLPVSFATVAFGNGQGLFADDEGIFIFNNNIYPDIDSLFISALGYTKISIATVNLNNEIFLTSETATLDEVVLSVKLNKKFKKEKLKPYLDDDYYNCWLPTIESEIAVLFQFDDSKTRKITSVQFPITPESKDWNKRKVSNAEKYEFSTLFKVKFYRNNNGIPGKEITNQNIVFVANEKDGNFYELDLSNYSIFIPKEGVFISLQVLGYTDDNDKLLPNKKYKEIKSGDDVINIPTNFRPLLPFTDKIEASRTFIKRVFIADNSWIAFKKNNGFTSTLLNNDFKNYGIGINFNTYKND